MPRYPTTRRSTNSRYKPYNRASYTRIPRSIPVKPNVEQVKAIATTIVNRKIERKRLNILRDDLPMSYINWYYTDPLQFIVVGNNEGQRISDKISDVWLKLSFQYCHYNTYANGSVLRVLVVKSDLNYPNHASAWVNATTGGDFPFLASNNFHQSSAIPDEHNYTVLADKRVTSINSYSATPYGVPGIIKLNVNIGKQFTYQSVASGVAYQKFRNVYILVGVSHYGSAPTTFAGYLQFSGYIYFRDG